MSWNENINIFLFPQNNPAFDGLIWYIIILWLTSDAMWHHGSWLYLIGSGYGLLRDGTKPKPEPMFFGVSYPHKYIFSMQGVNWPARSMT